MLDAFSIVLFLIAVASPSHHLYASNIPHRLLVRADSCDNHDALSILFFTLLSPYPPSSRLVEL